MKKTLILILVVLMALFTVSVMFAQNAEVDPAGTVPAAETAAVTESPAAEGASADAPVQTGEETAPGTPETTDEVEETPTETPAATEEGGETPAETPAATEEGGETPSETPAATEEGGETPSETPAATEEGGETPSDTPAATEEGGETPTETPAATEEGGETPSETPAATEENVETLTETPAATEENVETPAETPASTEENAETLTETPAATEENVETPAETPDAAEDEEEDSVIYMTVTIAGDQLTVKYDENDTNIYTAEGFTILSVDCTNEKGEPVTCPSFNEEQDLIYIGSDRAELPGNKIDKAEMGLLEGTFELKLEGVVVSFDVTDGYVEVVEAPAEPEAVDVTEEPAPEETTEPEGNGEEDPSGDGTEPEPAVENEEKGAEEDSAYTVFTNQYMTIRIIANPEPTPTPTPEAADDDTPVEPVVEGTPEGEEQKETEDPTVDEEDQNKEGGEDQTGDDLNKDAEDLKDEDEKENIEEQNENDEEKGEEENAEDQDKDKENAEEQNEKDEEKDAEDTDKDEFQTIVSGDGSAAGVTPEITDPAAGEGENTEDGEETEEETALKSIALTEDMVIFTAADAESEALAFTFEEGMELTVLSVDENGWAAVEFSDGTQGYVLMPQEGEKPETEPETETETDETQKSFILTAGTAVYAAADGEPLDFTAEEDLELTVLSVDENGWALVMLPDGTQGYVLMQQEEAAVDEKVTTEVVPEADDTPKSILLTEDMVIHIAADAESEALAFTFEEGMELTVLSIDEKGWALVMLPDGTQGYIQMPTEEESVTATVFAATAIRLEADGMSSIIFNPAEDMEVTILGVEGDWVKVELEDGTIGYIYINDIEFEGKPEKVYADKKVTIFTNHRPEMEEGEMITLTSVLEGFEDCVAIKLQWECDKGNGFEPVEGATGASYSFEVSEETLPWSWRLKVMYK